MPAPTTTSLAQCLSWYIRPNEVAAAPAYRIGPTYQRYCGHIRSTSLVTDAAAVNAVAACADGKLVRASLAKPFPNLKSRGLESAVTLGRERPSMPLSIPVIPVATTTASVLCQPRSSIPG